MHLPAIIHDAIYQKLGEVGNVRAISGGDIATAAAVETPNGRVFVKWGYHETGSAFIEEAEGLQALREANCPFVIPRIIRAHNSTEDEPGYLILEWLETIRPSTRDYADFGSALARLHSHHEDEGRYGFTTDNRIGRLPQKNSWMTEWPAFFAQCRLAPQIEYARQSGKWQSSWDKSADRLMSKLPELLPDNPPASITHGDLWSGNALFTSRGPALIDPATYFGHAETDLAMMDLFGGFPDEVYTSYFAEIPREAGFELRRQIYQLYHLLNHLNHFGAGYAGSVGSILAAF